MIWAIALAAAVAGPPASSPAVVAMTAGQALSALNAAWATQGEPRFEPGPGRSPLGLGACTTGGLCVTLVGSPEHVVAITLTGPATNRATSARYLAAQSLLVRLTSPGAPVLPAVTADRIAVGGTETSQAQLGLTCMRVQRSTPDTLSTALSRRRCEEE